MSHAILLISCPDQKGITASVTNFVYEHNGNIVHADQHIDEQSNTFFMRIEWSLEGFRLKKETIGEGFKGIADKFKMKWDLSFSDQSVRVAVFVSRHVHCLQDILFRQKAGQLACTIPLIISNHPDARSLADDFGIRFAEMPITKENKAEQEKKEIGLLKEVKADLIVLARYHQILTKDFIREFPNRIINIHHSFLPAFAGKNPYLQAYEKGVKIIGATSHYVTEELDGGPIIEQDTVRISHRDALTDLMRKGEDLEKAVLSRALRLALQKKILNYGNKTVVFD
ncbi:MAG TPA: formyltetrahydrofolate deformylase [Candidatus Omnitrophota bacterium]|nr:formyltetrahydrofolate deformylase [Candidatus Omnitrophota bacterium]